MDFYFSNILVYKFMPRSDDDEDIEEYNKEADEQHDED